MSLTKSTVAVLMMACVAACGAETEEEAPAGGAAVPANDGGAADTVPREGSLHGMFLRAMSKSAQGFPETVELEGVGTVRRVGTDMIFAGQLSPDALRVLAGQGLRTVLNTRGQDELDWDEKAVAAELGMTYAEIPMPYPIESIPDEWVDRFDELMKSAERPMLAHCSSGNRVAGLWAVWLAERQGVAPAEALELGKQAGMTRIRPVVERRLARSEAE